MLGPAALPPPHEYGTPICDMRAPDHVLGGLPAVDPGNRAVGVAARGGQEAELLQEVAAHLLGRPAPRSTRCPRTVLMIAIGSPLTNALGIAGSVGSHARVPVAGGRAAAAGCAVPVGRGVRRCGRGGGRRGRLGTARRRRPLCGPASSLACAAARSAVSRSSSACWAPKVCCASVSADTAVCWLASRVDDGLVGVLLGQPRGRLLVHLLGAGPLQIGDHLLRADRQRLTGRRGVEDVGGIGCGQVGIRRAVDIGCGGERVEALLRRGDRGVGVLRRAAGWRRPRAGRRRRCRVRSARRRSPC